MYVFTLSWLFLVWQTDRQPTVSGSKIYIVVLAMNRSGCLGRLLQSIQETDFQGDAVNLDIHFDRGENMADALRTAHDFRFRHGQKTITTAVRSLGLAASWYGALDKSSLDAHKKWIILEDDIILSPLWYKWLKAAWKHYHILPNIAGISLQRQTLIPFQPFQQKQVVNGHDPFLYALVGSIGFSPNPTVWSDFIDWVSSVNPSVFDINIPELITSEWWKRNDKKSIWTQPFIYYCLQHGIYTLYVNLENDMTLAAHIRAKGAHYPTSLGADFKVAKTITMNFPANVSTYDWDGAMVGISHMTGLRRITDTHNTVTSRLQRNVLVQTAKAKRDGSGYVSLVMINEVNAAIVIRMIEGIDTTIFDHIIFVSSDATSALTLRVSHPNLTVITVQDTSPEDRCVGWMNTCMMCNQILQAGISINIIIPRRSADSHQFVQFITAPTELVSAIFKISHLGDRSGEIEICELVSMNEANKHIMNKYERVMHATRSACDADWAILRRMLVSAGSTFTSC